jgi:WhiB family redox-sensing transcriptional regulator
MTARKVSVAIPARGGWRARAACGASDPELFFPDRAGTDIRTAQAICAGCPVQAECHEFADATNQVHGIWAGVDRGSPQARRKASAA